MEGTTMLQNAQPIFLAGLEETLNVQAGFRRGFCLDGRPQTAQVAITARSFYRLYVNGRLAMHGPARTAHGYLRVDVVDIAPWLTVGENCLAVETTASVGCLGGYSNDCTAESSLLLAALWVDGKQLLATGAGWDALRLTQRQQYSEKISHCRQNAEVYRLDADYSAWRQPTPDGGLPPLQNLSWQKAAVCRAPRPTLLERGMPLPDLQKQGGARLLGAFAAAIDCDLPLQAPWFEEQYADYYAKLSERPLLDYARTVETPLPKTASVRQWGTDGVTFGGLEADATVCALFDLGAPRLGFLGLSLFCETPCTVDVVHLEAIPEYDDKRACLGGVDPVTRLHLPAGHWRFLTMEPALARYVRVYFRGCGGACGVQDLHVRAYCYPGEARAAFACSDGDLMRLYDAACLTLRLNTLDIFMDCPDRERGGWLCDSFWTARAAALLLGDLSVERAFLENFLLAPYGDGVGSANNFFPEVYPASKLPGAPAITTWSFWLMLQLAEYVERSGDLALALAHQKRVEDFVAGARRYVGPSGLLQDMPFVFVDWSQANDAENTQPISTAANALYAYMLQRLGALYHRADWAAAGDRVREVLRAALGGKTGAAFRDTPYLPDALWQDADGTLHGKAHYTEACQYTALWSGLFAKEDVPVLARRLLTSMGPAPQCALDPMVGGAEIFIGLTIRFDLLAKWGETEALLRELRALFLPQLTEGPGTLWECRSLQNSSRCHGINGHVGVLLLRELLGLDIPQVFDLDSRRPLDADEQRARLAARPLRRCGLRWLRGAIPTAYGLECREEVAR